LAAGNSPHTEDVSWHPAFLEAIQMELEQYQDALQFVSEYQLSAEPLKIDVVIIKKARGVIIEKNIGTIFRTDNLVEYKSPTDYVSVDDFYKVYGYACLYTSLNKVAITDLILTFVESRYPRDVLTHLRKVRGYTVEERSSGIYTVTGDIIPIQIIDNRRLSGEENIWLKELDNELDVERISRITKEIDRLGKAAQIGVYLDAIARANSGIVQEALKMSDTALTLERVFEEAGLIAKWEARGEEKKAFKVARNLINKSWTPEEVAETTELDVETVKSLYPQK
jgi:hypothetical protein